VGTIVGVVSALDGIIAPSHEIGAYTALRLIAVSEKITLDRSSSRHNNAPQDSELIIK
jgi:hypothetical protein